jgi:hypothetical protein
MNSDRLFTRNEEPYEDILSDDHKFAPGCPPRDSLRERTEHCLNEHFNREPETHA